MANTVENCKTAEELYKFAQDNIDAIKESQENVRLAYNNALHRIKALKSDVKDLMAERDTVIENHGENGKSLDGIKSDIKAKNDEIKALKDLRTHIDAEVHDR